MHAYSQHLFAYVSRPATPSLGPIYDQLAHPREINVVPVEIPAHLPYLVVRYHLKILYEICNFRTFGIWQHYRTTRAPSDHHRTALIFFFATASNSLFYRFLPDTVDGLISPPLSPARSTFFPWRIHLSRQRRLPDSPSMPSPT